MILSQQTKEILLKSGWFQGRNIDTTYFEKGLTDEGYLLSSQVVSFLKEFGGLVVDHPHHAVSNEMAQFQLNPLRATEGIYREKVECYEKRDGEGLVTVGEAYNEHMVILMSSTGKVLAAYDDVLILLGLDPLGALEALCESKETPSIP